MRYKKGDSCYIKKDDKFIEGVVNKLAMPYHGTSYYKKGDTRYFVLEKKRAVLLPMMVSMIKMI